MPPTLTDTIGADLISAVAAESNEELASGLAEDFAQMSAAQARFVVRLGEYDRRQAFRDEGATSLESWTTERFGFSIPTARTYAHVGEKSWDIPEVVGSLSRADISFDKVRVLADVASPESDHEWCDQARACSVRELADLARTRAELARTPCPSRSASEHDRRFLRCNDAHRTLTAQFEPDAYAEVKTTLEALAKEVPSDGATPWDQRLNDGFLALLRARGAGSGAGTSVGGGGGGGGGGGTSPFFVVAHVPLASLVDETGQSTSLAGELDHVGLIDAETVRRIACDATIAIALDDDVGHTMYEGRARRFPTPAQRREILRRDRHCRFPGCTNVTFAHVHHIVPWEPEGLSDLDNLVLQCLYHHHLVHSDGWTMTGNANEELTITGPEGLVMTSRPSPLWTRATAGARLGAAG